MMGTAITPQKCIKPYGEWEREIEATEKEQTSTCIVRKATPEEIAAITAPKHTLAYDICSEMGLNRKKKKKPECPYELTLHKKVGLNSETNNLE